MRHGFSATRGKETKTAATDAGISTGGGKFGRKTQESCFHGCSSGGETEMEGDDGTLGNADSDASDGSEDGPQGTWVDVGVFMRSSFCVDESPLMCISSSVSFRPRTLQASIGRYTVFRICMRSLGHSRFAFLKTGAVQLYLIITPASVSSGLTLWR